MVPVIAALAVVCVAAGAFVVSRISQRRTASYTGADPAVSLEIDPHQIALLQSRMSRR